MISNFTAGFLEFRKKKILDNLGHQILTISYSKDVPDEVYSPPLLRFNFLFSKENPEKEPIIKRITLIEVERLNFVLCSIPIGKTQSKIWVSGQRIAYFLALKGSLEEQSAKKRYKEFPRDRKLWAEYDSANNKIRLCGQKASPTGKGVWHKVRM